MKTEDIVKELELNYGYTFAKEGTDNKWQFEWICEMINDVQNVVTKNCNLHVVMRCACCGNTTKFSDGAKQQILIEEEYRYIYAVTCDECGKVCDVELFD